MSISNTQPLNAGDPAYGAAAVTPNDDTSLLVGQQPTRGLWIGGAGDLVVVMADGTEATFNDVPAGTLLPLRVQKVKAATSATLITAIY